jgi:transcriptional regulator with XRE-family HTH domain
MDDDKDLATDETADGYVADDQPAMTIGTYLKQKRKLRGLTQTQVSNKLGISQNYYSEIEADKRQGKPELIMSIAHMLGIRPSYKIFQIISPDKDERPPLTDRDLEIENFQIWLSAQSVTSRDLRRIRSMVRAYLEEDTVHDDRPAEPAENS